PRAQSNYAAPEPARNALTPAPARPSLARPVDNIVPPPIPQTQAVEAPISAPRPQGPQARPQRSLEDLRGLGSMGPPQGQASPHSQRRTGEEADVDDASVDVPP